MGERSHHPDDESTDTWYWMVRGFVTVVVAADPGRRAWHIFLLAVVGLVWLAVVLLFGPARLSGYGAAFSYMALVAVGILILAALISAVVRLIARRASAKGAIVTGVIAAALFLLPFVFWATNALPSYLLAAGFAERLGLASEATMARPSESPEAFATLAATDLFAGST